MGEIRDVEPLNFTKPDATALGAASFQYLRDSVRIIRTMVWHSRTYDLGFLDDLRSIFQDYSKVWSRPCHLEGDVAYPTAHIY